MPAIKISEMNPAAPLVATDLFEVARTVENLSCTPDDILAYIKGELVDIDGTLAANSDDKVASQKAVKTYVNSVVGANDAMVFLGVIDCSANPNYPAGDRGNTYRVSVAGKIGGASGVNVEAGDLLLCLTDGTSAGDHATVGASWSIIQTNLDGAVIGPASAVSNNIVLFDGTTGKLIKDSGTALPAGTIVTTATNKPTECLAIACSDESTALTAGTAKTTIRMPYAFTLTEVRASVTTAPTGASLLTVDINENGTTILSTKLTFDASEKTTTTAATAAVISDTALANDAEITIDIDQIGSTIAGAGLKIYLIGTRT